MIKITVNGSLDSALKKLKFKFDKSNVKKELNDRKEFKKPSVVRRELIQKASYVQKRRDSEAD
jgi:small subunit ribosomal protein S21